MRTISSGVYLETKYPGVQLGAVVTEAGLLLIDSPTRAEDGRDWLAALSAYGKPRYLALLDIHPDRALGARNFDLPKIAHDWTCQSMNNWSDTYKGGVRPIGADANQVKRITGVRKAVPELTFSNRMQIYLGERSIEFLHRPGPTPGSIWVFIPEDEVAFIGDTVTVTEPPYLGEADIEAWLNTLEDLRGAFSDSCKMVSSRDGMIQREDINDMARFLRKIPWRLERLAEEEASHEAAAALAPELIEDFKVSKSRREQVLRRLEVGLTGLYQRLYPSET